MHHPPPIVYQPGSKASEHPANSIQRNYEKGGREAPLLTIHQFDQKSALCLVACRAGASAVYAVEKSARTTDLAAAVLAANDCSSCVELLHCDPRDLSAGQRLGRAAEVLLLEVCTVTAET